MYHAIVRSKVRALWRVTGDGSGNYHPAVAMAAPDLRFRFIGDNILGAELRGPEAFADWFEQAGRRFPGMRLTLTDVVVKGWPWNTTVVVRLRVDATLADGSSYENEGIQWVRIRWGRMVEDTVLEDTARLEEAWRRQELATSGAA
ncbi:nuclear transport factor 2 family protein [Streptomyces sp. NBC_01381]|uniref:nuclear transport factor 2 family protein n=1 Tax=unclassified Streptomyces TaxID=2593676 RepID=UPI002252D25E|nr:nuclear transport factor 2 family protein [Streptomyces sp. NBC_01381]MCX4668006.1 nuclear transport factor 2 family protein [Streptomyces sp. NBC_01381]